MSRDPALIQRVIRESAKERYDFIGDLNNWATEMKAKEVAASPEFLENMESVPTRNSSRQPCQKLDANQQDSQSGEKKIKSWDYDAWEKFDVEKACEDVDSDLMQTEAIDMSEEEIIKFKALKLKSKELALEKKELGNRYIREKNHDLAISSYSEGIVLDPSNSTLYANRAQAYINKGELENAKKDCDAALQIDPKYVKVLYRRAKLHVELGSNKEAEIDLLAAISLEPKNLELHTLLNQIQQRKRNQNSNINTSNANNMMDSSRHILKAKATKYTTTNPKVSVNKNNLTNDLVNASGDSAYPKIIKPITKLPQQRSKRPLFPIYVKVVGQQEENAKKTRIEEEPRVKRSGQSHLTSLKSKDNIQLEKLFSQMSFDNLPSKPCTAAQFEMHWKQLKSTPEYFAHYLKQMKSEDYQIFQNAMESPMLTDIFDALIWEFIPKNWDIIPHMEGLLMVRRLGTLIMFMNEKDRANARKLVSLCPESIQGQYSKFSF